MAMDYGIVNPSTQSANKYNHVMPVFETLNINGFVGAGLTRPECALAHQSGLLLAPCWAGSGGVSLVTPSKTYHHLAHSKIQLRPNGIALENGGSILLAHLGETTGGIFRLYPDGRCETVVTHANGEPLPPTNYVVKDSTGRIWITVSTRKTPRSLDYRATANSGFIAVADANSSNATIVADQLGYANECVIDEANERVWVNETFTRQLCSYKLTYLPGTSAPQLSERASAVTFTTGTYPDGLALDEEGYLWVTSIVSNRILRVAPNGQVEVVFEDADPTHIRWTETAYLEGRLGREHLDNAAGTQLKNISNLAFGGPNRQRIYLGNLLGSSIPWMETSIAGAPMVHWSCTLGDLEKLI